MSALPGPGDQFGAYRIERLLGSGAMGAVYAATQSGLNRAVALKVLLPMLADDPGYRKRFGREAEAMARVDSPHIIQVYDHGELNGCLFIAAQFVNGQDLQGWINQYGAAPVSVACTIGAQIAGGLAEAHAAEVIHRDVKPNNVLVRMIQGRPHAYLCDFGIATAGEERITSTGAVAGTWAYLAPERCQGEDATRSTDIYALGCVMWKMLTGRAPYSGTAIHLAMQHVHADIPQFEPSNPVALAVNRFLLRAMAKRPEDRYVDAATMQVELERIAALARAVGVRTLTPAEPEDRAAPAGSARWAPAPDPTPDLPPPAPAPAPEPAVPAQNRSAGGLATRPSTEVAPTVGEQPRRRPGGAHRPLLGLGMAGLLVMLAALTGGAWWVFRGDGGGGGTPGSGPWAPGQVSRQVIGGDFNGDTVHDVAVLVGSDEETAELDVLLGAGEQLARPVSWATGLELTPQTPMAAGDVTLDRLVDVVMVGEPDGSGRPVELAVSTGDAFTSSVAQTLPTTGPVQLAVGDVAANDLPDDVAADLRLRDAVALVGDGQGGARLLVMASDGTTLGEPVEWATGLDWDVRTTTVAVTRVNQDPWADLVVLPGPRDGATGVLVLLSDGETFADPEPWAEVTGGRGSSLVVTDVNGDGLGDANLVRRGGDELVVDVGLAADEAFEEPTRWGSFAGPAGGLVVTKTKYGDDRDQDLLLIRDAGEQGVRLSVLPAQDGSFGNEVALVTVPQWTWTAGS